ncbi:MAG: Phage integrase family protein, partial [Gammaproteobacteria bacterium]|nr:Phage integrase family protein [Gammaproteobacteria bacterium]
LFYWLYPHVIEMTARGNWIPQMNHFYKENKQNWQLKVLDKKKKLRTIWVSHEMLEALKRYRTSRGLKPLPSILDTSPLLPNEKGLAITGESDIRKIVQDCFDKVIEELRKDKLPREADKMELATITDLRQTGILDDMRKRGFSQIQVQKKMGEDLDALSTYPYNDTQLKKRYESAKNKKLIERFEV